MTIHVKRLSATAILPQYALPHDAGMDLYADESTTILPQERKLVSTGIALAIPPSYVGLVWDKSGIATKYGLKTMAGVIDSGYRGELKILIHNLSTQPYSVIKGTKIAQLLIQPVEQREIMEVDELDETERGEGGFGSTGEK